MCLAVGHSKCFVILVCKDDLPTTSIIGMMKLNQMSFIDVCGRILCNLHLVQNPGNFYICHIENITLPKHFIQKLRPVLTLQILMFCLHQGFYHLQASNQHNTLMTHLPTMQDSVHFSIFPDFWLECFGKISRGNRDKFPQHPGALYHGHRIERRDRKRRIIGRIVG